MMLQEASSPGALRRVEELAKMQTQQRVEAEAPSIGKIPESLKSQVESPRSEARTSEEKEKVMIKVQNKSGSSQSIRIYTVSKCTASHVSITVNIFKESTIIFRLLCLYPSSLVPPKQTLLSC